MASSSATLLLLLCVAALFSCTQAQSGYSFLSIGDWGGASLGDYHMTDELAVAKQFAKTGTQINASYVINVGDNFYYYGIKSTTDPQIKTDFEDVFTGDAMNVPWYSVLGNHDYGYDPDAQTQYHSPNNDRWVMPSRYFTKRVPAGPYFITFVFIDTNPCVQAYRDNDPSGWDPCGSTYPSPSDCKFHQNILAQDCGTQYSWLQKTVDAIPAGDWKIAVGHHPADEVDVNDFTSVFQNASFDLYLNGHAHTLTYYQIDNGGAYVTTGAGCMVKIDGEHDKNHLKLKQSASHSRQQVWNEKVAGFTYHTFSSDYTKLTTKFVQYDGKELYSFEVTKGAGPAPSPSPGPSTGSCAEYGCGSYDPSHSCQCNSYCKEHDDCCSDYQSQCGTIHEFI